MQRDLIDVFFLQRLSFIEIVYLLKYTVLLTCSFHLYCSNPLRFTANFLHRKRSAISLPISFSTPPFQIETRQRAQTMQLAAPSLINNNNQDARLKAAESNVSLHGKRRLSKNQIR